jgi:biotin operon repressor
MLRSFTTLASTLNLSKAVRQLGSTRQTVRRHISQLEELKGGDLFAVDERQYRLTELGAQVLPEAVELLAQAEGWLLGRSSIINGLQYLRHSEPNGWTFYQQQQPIRQVFQSSGTLLQDVMAAWIESGGHLEHEAMQPVRDHLMVYRSSPDGWLCTELGEECSYVSWFGWAAAKSALGRSLGEMPGGESFARLIGMAHAEVETNQSVRLDHAFTQIPREKNGTLVPICYERLLLGSCFPDESFALISVVRRTYDVDITGVDHDMLRSMPEELLM